MLYFWDKTNFSLSISRINTIVWALKLVLA